MGSDGTVLLEPLFGSLDEEEVDLGELGESQIFKLQFLVVEEVDLDELEDGVPLLLGGQAAGDLLPDGKGGGEEEREGGDGDLGVERVDAGGGDGQAESADEEGGGLEDLLLGHLSVS